MPVWAKRALGHCGHRYTDSEERPAGSCAIALGMPSNRAGGRAAEIGVNHLDANLGKRPSYADCQFSATSTANAEDAEEKGDRPPP